MFQCMQFNIIFINSFIYRKQMNINLDQIFGSTGDQSYYGTQYQSYQPSESESLKSVKNRLQFNVPIFDEDNSQSSSIITPIKSKTPSVISMQTSISSFGTKAPGERLYYQSRAQMARKKQEAQRAKLEKLKEQEQSMTFKPKINKNSEKIVEVKGKVVKPVKKQTVVPSHIKKQQQQMMQCTFKPQTLSKSSTMLPKTKSKDQVFEELFYAHKFKKVKQKMTQQQQIQSEVQKEKKLSKTELQGFLARSNDFLTKVEKKKQLILTTSTKYDLKTGKKLFSPNINVNPFKQQGIFFSEKARTPKAKPTYQQQQKSSVSSSQSKQIKTKPIFTKNNEEQIDEQLDQYKPVYQNNSRRQVFTKHENFDEQEFSYDQEEYEDGKKILNIIQENEEKLDQQHEVTDEAPHFQTVHGFEFPSENQMKRSEHFEHEEQQNQVQEDPGTQNQQREQRQVSGIIDNQKIAEVQPFETSELPTKEKEQKQSEYADTQYEGYEGEDSRLKMLNK